MGPVLVSRHERQDLIDRHPLRKELKVFTALMPIFVVGILYVLEDLLKFIDDLRLEFLPVSLDLLLHDGTGQLFLRFSRHNGKRALILDNHRVARNQVAWPQLLRLAHILFLLEAERVQQVFRFDS